MEKGSLGYQMKVLRRLESSGKITPFERATWVIAVATGKVTSILGIGIDFTTDSQKGLFNIARKVNTQFGLIGNIAGKVKDQGSGTGLQIAGTADQQIQIVPFLPGIQIAGKVTRGQGQLGMGIQLAGLAKNQGQGVGIQLAGTIQESQQQVIGIQGSLRNEGIKDSGLKMLDNRPSNN